MFPSLSLGSSLVLTLGSYEQLAGLWGAAQQLANQLGGRGTLMSARMLGNKNGEGKVLGVMHPLARGPLWQLTTTARGVFLILMVHC